MYDLIIIGAGPAGMSAAIYAARQKLDFAVIAQEFGGQMVKKEVEIENYPGFGRISALDLIKHFKKHLESFGVEVRKNTVSKLEKSDGHFLVSTDAGMLESETVIVATGSAPRFLGVPGEKELLGKGVGYCATCDGPLFRGRDVAVVGGGNAAFESAIFLAKFAKKIYLLEYGARIRADASNQELAAKTGKVEVINNANVLRIEGKKMVSAIAFRDNVSGRETVLPVEGVFVKAGSRPASGFAAGVTDLNERGEIIFDHETYQTKTPGLFVAGDVGNIKYKQIVIAAGEGAKAALAAEEYLGKMSNKYQMSNKN